jgi:hypothetical protein
MGEGLFNLTPPAIGVGEVNLIQPDVDAGTADLVDAASPADHIRVMTDCLRNQKINNMISGRDIFRDIGQAEFGFLCEIFQFL